MVGAQRPENPYVVLENSFFDLRPQKQALHHDHGHGHHDIFPAAQPVRTTTSFADDASVTSGQGSGLPPTPPEHDRDQPSPSIFRPPPFADGVVTALLDKLLPPAPSARSPPTPETTPPATLRIPHSGLSQLSRESFVTAREEQPEWHSSSAFNSPNMSSHLYHTRNYSHPGIANGNLPSTPISPNRKLTLDTSPRRLSQFTTDHRNPNRHSASSQASTAVEAIIVDHTPPHKRRILRHAAKGGDLRREVGHETDGSTTVRGSPSERNSNESLPIPANEGRLPLQPKKMRLDKTRDSAGMSLRQKMQEERRIVSEPMNENRGVRGDLIGTNGMNGPLKVPKKRIDKDEVSPSAVPQRASDGYVLKREEGRRYSGNESAWSKATQHSPLKTSNLRRESLDVTPNSPDSPRSKKLKHKSQKIPDRPLSSDGPRDAQSRGLSPRPGTNGVTSGFLNGYDDFAREFSDSPTIRPVNWSRAPDERRRASDGLVQPIAFQKPMTRSVEDREKRIHSLPAYQNHLQPSSGAVSKLAPAFQSDEDGKLQTEPIDHSGAFLQPSQTPLSDFRSTASITSGNYEAAEVVEAQAVPLHPSSFSVARVVDQPDPRYSRHSRTTSQTSVPTRHSRTASQSSVPIHTVGRFPELEYHFPTEVPPIAIAARPKSQDRPATSPGLWNTFPRASTNKFPRASTNVRPVSQGTEGSIPRSGGPRQLSSSAPEVTIQPSTPPSTQDSFPVVVDSPYKSPRQAPIPPCVQVIPPTPSTEIDALDLDGPISSTPVLPQRRASLSERARRSIVEPCVEMMHTVFGVPTSSAALASPSSTQSRLQRPKNLSANWRPRKMEYDTDSDDSSMWGDDEPEFGEPESDYDRLPTGGDTSNVGSEEDEPQAKGLGSATRTGGLTRGQSVKRLLGLEGFRGSGGFLIGNSLGMERAGTNRRRHYVDMPLRARKLATATSSSPSTDPTAVANRSSGYSAWSNSDAGSEKRARAMKRKWMGRVREWRAERRRRELKKRIGLRFYVDR
ncbi:hypothetical protein K402DRAFT_390054 [Aulographum hederae CBS 113979]|uniref:Uncharacterized protein n=1 Tax=Aulographum hederae CBS 113979 TaxID=1176131 RepID=A0A6G1HB35_9PEZI|nr:hypothetical protein K402DRAFT_390054 [Aulographum hederae CBS 113979]